MQKNENKILPFPPPASDPARNTIIAQIGRERFAIRYEFEDLPASTPDPTAADAAHQTADQETEACRVILPASPSLIFQRLYLIAAAETRRCGDPFRTPAYSPQNRPE